jgi:hypothetical protein
MGHFGRLISPSHDLTSSYPAGFFLRTEVYESRVAAINCVNESVYLIAIWIATMADDYPRFSIWYEVEDEWMILGLRQWFIL